MAYNFKNLAEVELLDAMPETANVLVEVDGATKRAPKEDGIGKLVSVEALEEVPENATVLAEVNGEIKRVPGSGLGGSECMVVNFTTPEVSSINELMINTVSSSGPSIVADKTYMEIRQALIEGQNVIGLSSTNGQTMVFKPDFVDFSEDGTTIDEGYIVFSSMSSNGMVGNGIMGIMIFPDETIEFRLLLQYPSTTGSVISGNTAPVTSGGVYTYVEGKGYQTEEQVNTLINNALGVIENGTY